MRWPCSEAKSGNLRLLSVTPFKRFHLLTGSRSVTESGVPGYESSGWYAFWATAGTPRQILAKLNTDVTQILTSTAMKEQLATQGLDAIPTSPEGFAKQLRVEIAKWAKVVKATGAKPE